MCILNIRNKDQGNKDNINDLIIFHLVLMLSKNMLAATNEHVLGINQILNNGITILLAIVYCFVFFKDRLYKRIPKETFIVVVCLGLFIFVTRLRVNDLFSSPGVVDVLRTFLSYGLPLFILCSFVHDIDSLSNKLFKMAYFLFVISCLCCFFSIHSRSKLNEYSMSFGYSVLFINLIFLFKYSYYHRKKDAACFVITFIIIFISGSRGPLIYCFWGIFFVLFLDSGIKNRHLYIVLFLFMALFVLLFYRVLLDMLFKIMGSSSRTLNMLSAGVINNDSGRGEIYEKLINEINQNPLMGIGAFGGEYAVYRSHHMILDAYANFGYILGSILIAFIFVRGIKTLKATKGTPAYYLFGMLFILTFGGAFFTGSIFGTKELWMMMGLQISRQQNKSRLYLIPSVLEFE